LRNVVAVDASASRGEIEPSVATFEREPVEVRRLLDARRVDLERVRRRTGEKIASTGITPIRGGSLVALGREVPRPCSTVRSEREAPGCVTVAM